MRILRLPSELTETSTRIIKRKVPAALSLVGLAQKYKSYPEGIIRWRAAACCDRKSNRE